MASDLFDAPVEMVWVISLWQPHASLMFAFLDGVRCKPDETRHWPFPAALRGKRVVIHAAQRRVTRDEAESALGDLCAKLYGPNWRTELPYGVYLGDVLFGEPLRMADHGPLHDLDELCGHWSPTRWAWRTTEPRALAEPIPAKGQQGFWRVPASALTPEDDGCCPGCGACPGFIGVDCDETCEWATTGGGAALAPVFSPEQKRRALDLIKPDHTPAMELEEMDALRRQYRSTGGGDGR